MTSTRKRSIAGLRIHVERAINKIKNFLIWKGEIPLCVFSVVNQMWSVCAFVCNTQNPLISEEFVSFQGRGGRGLRYKTDRDALHTVNLGVLTSGFEPCLGHSGKDTIFLHLPRPCLDLSVFDHRSLSHCQIGLLQGFHSKFSISIPSVLYGSPLPYTVSFSLIFLQLRSTSRTG